MDDGYRGLRLFNTMTRTKEEFRPLDWQTSGKPEAERRVTMYVCGPTVYDYAHIGNARPVVVFDVLFRLLRHLYGADHVAYARNITDVDDKINARAARDYPDLPLNEAIAKVTSATAEQFHKDIAALGALPPTIEPRATDHIAGMRAMIDKLVENGHAYVAEGHVLFHTPSMADYGQLSRRSLDEMIAGARIEVASYKKDPSDFVLWKPSSEGEPGWPSPAGIEGLGRPGWHIECSAMSAEHLGPVIDIHGGGLDLIFPHHENEIAQSRCAHDTERMAQVWMHNGYLQVEGRKMSKSEGNFVTIDDVLRKPVPALVGLNDGSTHEKYRRAWNGRVARLVMLMTHYRQPLDWTDRQFYQAYNELLSWHDILALHSYDHSVEHEYADGFIDALCDDLNISDAITILRRLYKEGVYWELGAGMKLLGLFDPGFLDWDSIMVVPVDPEFLEKQISQRLDFIKAKNWAEADRIRDELQAKGIQLKDGKDPATGERVTTWEVKR
ncbi:cysteine--tRNA ligase [Consotaella salsifontis]|uniref:Cysteine--tRNA ligase n=1 Tax=Consotaella salsifontis TaxID=1365950 RepID=A0A1T4T6M5_9HYPH|nr:cysteine--tRNA ligase [Consotaella salsifontis]SKA36190.1 cysteinyl-tRNA synthetase [Consotaella salsifontis]